MADGSAAMAAGDRGALDMGLLADGSIDQDRMRRGALYGLLCPNGAGASGAAADPHSLQALEQCSPLVNSLAIPAASAWLIHPGKITNQLTMAMTSTR